MFIFGDWQLVEHRQPFPTTNWSTMPAAMEKGLLILKIYHSLSYYLAWVQRVLSCYVWNRFIYEYVYRHSTCYANHELSGKTGFKKTNPWYSARILLPALQYQIKPLMPIHQNHYLFDVFRAFLDIYSTFNCYVWNRLIEKRKLFHNTKSYHRL